MGQFPAILQELNDPGARLHIGGVLSFMEPLCRKISEDETDILGWLIDRDRPVPREKICPECFALYERGLAWKPPSARR